MIYLSEFYFPSQNSEANYLAESPRAKMTCYDSFYPFGLFASPMSEIVRLHASSGTTGKPIVVAYTQEDLQVWASVMLRTFSSRRSAA